VRVLLVDEERMVAALRRGLAAEGFVVESAADGAAGLRLAQHDDFDAVVLDVMLPKLSGHEVVRQLRAHGNWVPILMLSAKDGEYDQADALDDGADDYLTKPFSFVVLLARIRALLRRGARARPVVLDRLPVPSAADEIRALAVTLNEMLDRLAELGNASDRSWRTRLMSCAAHWPAFRRNWRLPRGSGKAGRCLLT
jgi:DNA-binding response OmpR family regulator